MLHVMDDHLLCHRALANLPRSAGTLTTSLNQGYARGRGFQLQPKIQGFKDFADHNDGLINLGFASPWYGTLGVITKVVGLHVGAP